MTPRRDDDALSWDGDDDPTLDVRSTADEGAEPSTSAAMPEGFTAVGRGSDTYRHSEADHDPVVVEPDVEQRRDEPRTMGNAELITLGVIGGFSVLYAVGWLIGGLRLQGTAEFLVAPLAYQISLWLAVVAPLAWFTAVLVLSRGHRLWVRFAWLVGGVVLLVPWPFIMVGAIGR